MTQNTMSLRRLGDYVSATAYLLLRCQRCLGEHASIPPNRCHADRHSNKLSSVDGPSSSTLKSHLLNEPDSDQGLCHDFMLEAVQRAEEDDTIIPAFVNAVEEMTGDLSVMSFNSDYKPYMLVCLDSDLTLFLRPNL